MCGFISEPSIYFFYINPYVYPDDWYVCPDDPCVHPDDRYARPDDPDVRPDDPDVHPYTQHSSFNAVVLQSDVRADSPVSADLFLFFQNHFGCFRYFAFSYKFLSDLINPFTKAIWGLTEIAWNTDQFGENLNPNNIESSLPVSIHLS